MGNNETVGSRLQSLNSENWVEAGQDQQNAIFSNVNPYRRRLLANVITHELIEQYELNFITEEDFNSYTAELTYRQIRPPSQSNNHHNIIYPIRYFVNKSKHEMCTTIHTGYLYADKVELRLKEINDIPFQDLLYMYKATLNGFKLLYEKVGYFDIVEQMIFITNQGEVKVWMNANLAKNYPNYEKTSNTTEPAHSQREHQNIYGSQADMIRKLILMIQKNSDQLVDSHQSHQQNVLFSEFLQDKNIFEKLSFQHSLEEFENYLSQNHLHCPDFMRSIPELFCPDERPQLGTNYELSQVNEITSQHLRQMKKKLEPMETILEDQNFNSKTTQKLHNSHQRGYIQESHVAMYTPHQFSHQREQHFGENQNRLTVKPINAPFVDLNHSRHSYQNNKMLSEDYTHLQKSSKSSNSPHSFIKPKPNSVSALNYNHNHIQPQHTISVANQPHLHFAHLHPVIISPPHHVANGHFQQFHSQYPNEFSQRIAINSPPPSFRMMNGGNNPFFPPIHQTQPNNLPPPSFVSFQNVQVSNQTLEQIKKGQRISFQPQSRTMHLIKNNELATKSCQYSGFNEGTIRNGFKQTKYQQGSVPLMGQAIKKEQGFSETKRMGQTVEEKPKIKYFTKNDSYQLDQQIASDLEKFLGLKVN